ncbi:MAG: hypothetical protein JKY97_00510, partial [Citromicrobium sp.]|nr:hypothetical protein [Citromicrobium sp.]
MPGIDGYEVCRQLKADAKYTDTLVVFVSAHGEVEGFEEQIRQHSGLEASALDEALAEIGDLDG